MTVEVLETHRPSTPSTHTLREASLYLETNQGKRIKNPFGYLWKLMADLNTPLINE